MADQGQKITSRYEPVIGLEVHCQLKTVSKLFCGCSTAFGTLPNEQVCPVCLGMPGVLPVLNKKAVDYSIKMGLALGSQVHQKSEFSRKQYFYPDLPKNYQITQYDHPVCEGGGIRLDDGKWVRLNRIHIEEDAGKSVHEGRYSYLDLNRAGTPLIEIVSEPDLSSPLEASEYLKKLRDIARYLDVSDGNLEEGSFRCDANVSLRPKGTKTLGVRCEIKNLNSFRNIEKAIAWEILRQADLLDEGRDVEQQTRLWDPAAGKTRFMRAKGDGEDYRYFPDPDLPPLILTSQRINDLKASLPELPHEKALRYQESLGLTEDDALRITADKDLADFFEQTQSLCGDGLPAKLIANWLCAEYLREYHDRQWSFGVSGVTAKEFAELINLINKNTISGKIAKKVFKTMAETGKSASLIVSEENLEQITDEGPVLKVIGDILDAHPGQVAEFHSGKSKLLGFFVGKIMARGQGKFNPGLVQRLLRKALDARDHQ